MDYPVDDAGFLADDAPVDMAGGQDRSVFKRRVLERSLRSFGEDELADRVDQAIGTEEIRRIGERCARLLYTTDPARKSGEGYPMDKALATAAVEVLEGTSRPLARKRRRPG